MQAVKAGVMRPRTQASREASTSASWWGQLCVPLSSAYTALGHRPGWGTGAHTFLGGSSQVQKDNPGDSRGFWPRHL